MNEDQAQEYHEGKQRIADRFFYATGRDAADPHYGGCWCCCWDCGFEFHRVADPPHDGLPYAEFIDQPSAWPS